MRRLGGTMRRALMVIATVTLCATVSAYLYATSGKSRIYEQPGPVSDGVNIILEAAEFDPAENEVTLRVELAPVGSYLNDAKDAFAVPLRMATKNVVDGAVSRDIAAGTPVGKDYFLIYPLEGDPLEYPLDRYRYSYQYTDKGHDHVSAPLVKIEKVTDRGDQPVPVGLVTGPRDGLEGWTEHWNLTVDGPTLKTKLMVERSGGLMVFVAIILVLLVVIANLALLVAWSAFTARRPVEPGYASWLSALLFALIPLRVNLPGAPPIGAWIDALVFYWVEVVLLFAMAIFIVAWFRYRDVPEYAELHAAQARRRRRFTSKPPGGQGAGALRQHPVTGAGDQRDDAVADGDPSPSTVVDD
jgi:uncharacterized membrane protein YhaH (DUF805 family)